MAEEAKAEKKEEVAPEAEGGTKSKFSGLLKTILIFGGSWFVLQIVVVAIVWWFFHSATTPPAPAQAAPVEQAATQDEPVPVPALPKDEKIRAINTKSGQLVYWSIKVTLRVPKSQEKLVRERLEANVDLVKQEITTVVGASDPVILEQEADHATLKRQLCFALNAVLGKSLISEVVIPECLPARAD